MQDKRPNGKRVKPPRAVEYAKCFSRDWQALFRSGCCDLKKLERLMLVLIANDEPIGLESRDHALSGNWRDHRECHAGGDLLLIYQISEDVVIFVRAGTHAQLFK